MAPERKKTRPTRRGACVAGQWEVRDLHASVSNKAVNAPPTKPLRPYPSSQLVYFSRVRYIYVHNRGFSPLPAFPLSSVPLLHLLCSFTLSLTSSVSSRGLQAAHSTSEADAMRVSTVPASSSRSPSNPPFYCTLSQKKNSHV